MAHPQAIHNDHSDRNRAFLLDDDIRFLIGDTITSALSVSQSTTKIANQLGGRASLEQPVGAAIELLREQAVTICWLDVEIDRPRGRTRGAARGCGGGEMKFTITAGKLSALARIAAAAVNTKMAARGFISRSNFLEVSNSRFCCRETLRRQLDIKNNEDA
jgi:hypothetical protein